MKKGAASIARSDTHSRDTNMFLDSHVQDMEHPLFYTPA